jgi:hypothetical protein
MTFMNPWLLLGALGIGLPILAHLLNRYQVKRTDWAAMRFLNRSVRVRSRQIRLRDILLLLLRCLAILLLVLAISKPAMKEADGVASQFGERRAGVIIALDVSSSMQHSDGTATRFARALEKIETIAGEIHPADPVCLVLLGAEHRIIVRNMAFDPERFGAILHAQQATAESLDLDSVPRRLKELADGMEAPQKEIYIVTDMQAQDWKNQSAWLRGAFEDLRRSAGVCIVPVPGGADNLAITNLELVSGPLRKGTVARYRATVRNCGTSPVAKVRVKGMLNNITVDTKTIPAIAAGAAETVSLFVPFRNPGSARITAKLDTDSLLADNSRRAVAIIRDRVSVLVVDGSSGGSDKSTGLITAALRARGNGAGQEDFTVQSAPWVSLPAQDLNSFDVVILADVPDITSDQARRFEEYVRGGKGLIWFPGDKMKAAVWNQRSALEGTPLLPASIEQTLKTSDAMGVGGALDPIMPDHPVCRPLLALAEDLLSEARFLKLLQVKSSPTSVTVLSLAGSGRPVLIEHAIGRGHVFMFTTSAGPAWNNMAVTPVFPMILQQMVTYLTAREFEKPRMIGDSLSLSYVDQPDASDAVFDTPSGQTITVPVREYRNQYMALLEHARQAGFYLARVSVQAPGMPVAVNVDTRESNVKCLPASETVSSFEGTDIMVANSDMDLVSAIEQMRRGRSFWPLFMLAGLMLLVVESLLADRMLKSPSPANKPAPTSSHTENI